MKPVTRIEGRMVPLYRADIDTDQIMPKQFLKRVERTGFGEFVFHDWRAEQGFVLNDPRYQRANVLVTGPNFGSGSSREHAPWGLQQHGFEAIIAPSFADIFRSNSAKIGLLCVELDEQTVKALARLATERPETTVVVDLPEQRVEAAGIIAQFSFDPHTKHLLLQGLDAVALTLQQTDAIAAFESRRPDYMPVASARGAS